MIKPVFNLFGYSLFFCILLVTLANTLVTFANSVPSIVFMNWTCTNKLPLWLKYGLGGQKNR